MNGSMPKQLGKYEIESVLGQGAMGLVYKGFDPGIERTVAIKTVKTDMLNGEEDEKALARFKREAQSAGRLNHPNVITIYDYGEDDGIVYFAMEYIEGSELKELLENNARLAIDDIVKLVVKILRALEYAHSKGVIHRDIKPGNILLVNDSLEDIRIMDFGIAKVASSTMTQLGNVLGTPSYMSPEQFMGQRIDPRTDLYSVGVMLYQMLSGEKPFTGAMTTIMHKALKETPIDPSDLNVQCPSAFNSVVKKAMAKVPDERFQTAGEFILALESAFKRMPDSADNFDSDETVFLADKIAAGANEAILAKPKKGGGGLFAIAILLVAVLGGGGWWMAQQGEQEKTQATAPREEPVSAPPAAIAYIEVVTTPKQVSIRLSGDDKLLGISPVTLELAPGKYNLALSKEGYYGIESSVEAQIGNRMWLEVELTKKP